MKESKRSYAWIILVLAGALLWAAESPGQTVNGGITGKILDAETLAPLPGATIVVIDQFASTAADRDGIFTLSNLSPGNYMLQISNVGYATQQVNSIAVANGQMADVTVRLTSQPITLKTITVSPGRFNIMGAEPAVKQSLTQQEIKTMPQLGDDFFRTVNRLPGVSSNDFSTRFNIRGGEYEEVLVTLDGLQLYEPFHLKDIDGGAMSIVDVAAVRSLELITGGFPANHGDKMSGVLDIHSRSVPADQKRLSVGLSFVNARALAEGTFADNRGSWLVSARRGYIEYVLHMAGADDQIKPRYYDVFGKLQYQLGKNHNLSAHVLRAGDDLRYQGDDDDAGDTLLTKFGNSYFWLNLWSQPHPKLLAQTVASVGRVDHDRRGQGYSNWMRQVDETAHDEKDFRFAGLKSDWEYEASDKLVVKIGADVRRQWTDYDYQSRDFLYEYREDNQGGYYELVDVDTVMARFDKSGTKLSAYLTNRFRLDESLVAEFGLRYDHASYSGDDLFSPRVNLVYDLGEKTTIRGGWGYYRQIEGINEIAAGDGETDFHPAQKAEHRVIGIEHEYASGINLRLEIYQKVYSDLRPALRNSFDDIEAFPERESDRTIIHREATDARGIEVYLKKDTGGKFSWWLSYAYAKVEDSVRYIYFPPSDVSAYYDIVVPTPNDQRHTFYADLHYRPTPRWQCTMAFQYHTGWPFTDIYIASQTTPDGTVQWAQSGWPWGERHDAFHRLDFRINRYFPLSRGRITAFIEMLNVLGRDNVRRYNYSFYGGPGGLMMEKEPENWFGRIPSFGLSYEVSF